MDHHPSKQNDKQRAFVLKTAGIILEILRAAHPPQHPKFSTITLFLIHIKLVKLLSENVPASLRSEGAEAGSLGAHTMSYIMEVNRIRI